MVPAGVVPLAEEDGSLKVSAFNSLICRMRYDFSSVNCSSSVGSVCVCIQGGVKVCGCKGRGVGVWV